MFAFLEGTVAEKSNCRLVLRTGGIGWDILCSNTTLQSIPPPGSEATVYTWLSIREDAMEVFGFATKEEKQMFLLLISISGIGPKTALGILGAMPLRDLNLAILLGDTQALSRAPGIGKKTAQRITMELRDKVSGADAASVQISDTVPGSRTDTVAGDSIQEAIDALIALGYTSAEARDALSRVKSESGQSEDLVRLALRGMAGV